MVMAGWGIILETGCHPRTEIRQGVNKQNHITQYFAKRAKEKKNKEKKKEKGRKGERDEGDEGDEGRTLESI